MTTDIKKFFEALNYRFGSENDLSDITYVMCESSLVFRQFFFDFFFKESRLLAEKLAFRREVVCAGGRPDFVVANGDGDEEFWVEVKIGDRNQHFDQYEKSLIERMKSRGIDKYDAKSHIGYIANYAINEQNVPESRGFKNIHTWEEFFDELETYHWFGDAAIEGYGEFLRQVCNFVSIDDSQLCFEDFSYAFELYRTLERILKEDIDGVEIHGRGKPNDPHAKMGYNFCVKDVRGCPVLGWIGIWIGNESDEFVMGFQDREGWGKEVCDAFGRKDAYVDKTVEWDPGGWLWFYLDGEANEENIKGFIEDTIVKLRNGVNGLRGKERRMADRKSCVAIRKLTEVIEKRFYSDFVCGECSTRLAIEFLKDGFEPGSCSGQYFVANMGERQIKGWVGFEYNDEEVKGFKIELRREDVDSLPLPRAWKKTNDEEWYEDVMSGEDGRPKTSVSISEFTKWYRQEMQELVSWLGQVKDKDKK